MGLELEIIPTRCPYCNGKGKTNDAECIRCNGTGSYKDSRKHPLCGPDEVFVGNQQGNKPRRYLLSLKTMRLVQPAFDINANRLEEWENCWAIIMNKSDSAAYNRIMERRLSETCRGIKHADD